jgi:hypothetical protein
MLTAQEYYLALLAEEFSWLIILLSHSYAFRMKMPVTSITLPVQAITKKSVS